MQALAEQVTSKQTHDPHMLAEERKRKNYADFWNPIPVTEPFRVVLSDIRDRLYHTRELLHHCLVHSRSVTPAPVTALVHCMVPDINLLLHSLHIYAAGYVCCHLHTSTAHLAGVNHSARASTQHRQTKLLRCKYTSQHGSFWCTNRHARSLCAWFVLALVLGC